MTVAVLAAVVLGFAAGLMAPLPLPQALLAPLGAALLSAVLPLVRLVAVSRGDGVGAGREMLWLLARLLGTSALVYLGGRMALRLDLAAAVVFGGEILLTLARPHEFERFTSVNRKK